MGDGRRQLQLVREGRTRDVHTIRFTTRSNEPDPVDWLVEVVAVQRRESASELIGANNEERILGPSERVAEVVDVVVRVEEVHEGLFLVARVESVSVGGKEDVDSDECHENEVNEDGPLHFPKARPFLPRAKF